MTECKNCIHKQICGDADCLMCKHLDSEWHCKQCCHHKADWFECRYYIEPLAYAKKVMKKEARNAKTKK